MSFRYTETVNKIREDWLQHSCFKQERQLGFPAKITKCQMPWSSKKYFRIKRKYLHSAKHIGKMLKVVKSMFLLNSSWKPLLTLWDIFRQSCYLPNAYRFSRFIYICKWKIGTPIILPWAVVKSHRRKEMKINFITILHGVSLLVLKQFILFSPI